MTDTTKTYRVDVFYNRTMADAWQGYVAGQTLDTVGEFQVDAASDAEALNRTWAAMNRGSGFECDRLLDGRRSMSVGDVLVVDGQRCYGVAGVGFDALNTAVVGAAINAGAF